MRAYQMFTRALILVMAVGILAGAVSADNITISKTYSLDGTQTTPINFWAGLILLGVALFLISLHHFPGGEEDIVSVLAWIPTGYAMFASFAVDRVSSSVVSGTIISGTQSLTVTENHAIHSYWPVAIILFIFLCVCIFNTYRIVTNANKEGLPRGEGEREPISRSY